MNKKLPRNAVSWMAIAMLVALAFTGSFLLAGRSKEDHSHTRTGFGVTDHLGRNVTVPHDVQRVVSLASSATETIYALGAGEMVVGVDAYSNYPPEVIEKTCVGSGSAPSREMIKGLDPDVIFAWPYSRDAVREMEDEIAVIYMDPGSIDEVLDTIRLVGAVINRTSEAHALAAGMRTEMDNVTGKIEKLNTTEKPLVYYELGGAMRSAGPGTFTDGLIKIAGGVNLAGDEPVRYPILGSEYIIDRNPDVIVIVSYGASIEEIKNRGGWESMNAVRNNRIYSIDTNLVTSNPRVVQGLELFARWFYPDAFEEGKQP